jgi:hypothetical protein
MGSGAREVDESLLRVGANELGSQLVAHIESRRALGKKSFDVRLQDANEGSVVSYTTHDGIEDFANFILHSNGSQPFRHFTLDFSGGIFFLRAVGRDSG